MTQLLLVLTLIVTAAVVLVLVGYLVGIIVALAKAQASLKRLANHLQRTRDASGPLPEHMRTINGVLPELLDKLQLVNRQLEAILGVAGQFTGQENRQDAV